jgi:hypothetical protein
MRFVFARGICEPIVMRYLPQLDQQPEAEDEMDDGDSSGTLSSIQSSVDGFITALKEKKEDIVPEWADKYTAGVRCFVDAPCSLLFSSFFCLPCHDSGAM